MKIRVKITNASNMTYFKCAKDTIKEIELEDYVRCVVASEIGNASLEACKAQAVACRSYAIARGVLQGKIISDDARVAQAYIASRNNYSRCNEATEATKGQVLLYDGKCADTYYSHSNGGRTYSYEEVWGGMKNYLIAREDQWTAADGAKKNGHGVGLSQVGAKYAANHGVNYRTILNFYYPNTVLSTVDINTRTMLEEVRSIIRQSIEKIKEGL